MSEKATNIRASYEYNTSLIFDLRGIEMFAEGMQKRWFLDQGILFVHPVDYVPWADTGLPLVDAVYPGNERQKLETAVHSPELVRIYIRLSRMQSFEEGQVLAEEAEIIT